MNSWPVRGNSCDTQGTITREYYVRDTLAENSKHHKRLLVEVFICRVLDVADSAFSCFLNKYQK